jgi:integrase
VRIEKCASTVQNQKAGEKAEETMKGVYEKKTGSGIWYVRFADKTGRIRKEKAGTKSAAEKLYFKRKNEVLQGKKLPETLRRRVILFSEIAEDALEYSRQHKRSYRDDKSRMKLLKKWFGNLEAESLCVDEIEKKLCQAATASKWAPSTFNHYRSLVMLVYREARRVGKVSTNPGRDVRHRREDNSRVRQLTPAEEGRLRKVMRRRYRWHEPELDLALNTGLRQGNQYGLEWDMVDFNGKMLNIPRSKNEEPLHVYLNKPAVEALEKVRRQGNRSGRVFRAKSTGDPLRGPRTWFERALKDAKIDGFHWHDLRHTFASRLRQKGAKLEDIAEALGHKTLMMTKRYAHLGPKGLHDIVALIEQKPTGPRTDPRPEGANEAVRELPVQ